jgi:hypothetical protein
MSKHPKARGASMRWRRRKTVRVEFGGHVFKLPANWGPQETCAFLQLWVNTRPTETPGSFA